MKRQQTQTLDFGMISDLGLTKYFGLADVQQRYEHDFNRALKRLDPIQRDILKMREVGKSDEQITASLKISKVELSSLEETAVLRFKEEFIKQDITTALLILSNVYGFKVPSKNKIGYIDSIINRENFAKFFEDKNPEKSPQTTEKISGKLLLAKTFGIDVESEVPLENTADFQLLEKCLSEIDPVERKYLELRFGFENGLQLSISKAADLAGVTEKNPWDYNIKLINKIKRLFNTLKNGESVKGKEQDILRENTTPSKNEEKNSQKIINRSEPLMIDLLGSIFKNDEGKIDYDSGLLISIIDKLKPELKALVEFRLGIECSKPMSRLETAEFLDMSPSRVLTLETQIVKEITEKYSKEKSLPPILKLLRKIGVSIDNININNLEKSMKCSILKLSLKSIKPKYREILELEFDLVKKNGNHTTYSASELINALKSLKKAYAEILERKMILGQFRNTDIIH